MGDRFLIGKRVEHFRKRRGMSRVALAGLLGMSESWVREVEHGRVIPDRLPVLLNLADALRVDLVAFLCEEIPSIRADDHQAVLAMLASTLQVRTPGRVSRCLHGDSVWRSLEAISCSCSCREVPGGWSTGVTS